MSSPLSPYAKVKDKGRPRSFSDEVVFDVVTRIGQTRAFSRLTLAAVARNIGCTGQALNARFGSRLSLVIAYQDWANERDMNRFRLVREAHPSPLSAIRARFQLPVEGRGEELSYSGNQIRVLSLLSETQQDPEFAQRFKMRVTTFENQLSMLIQEAVEAEELKVEDCDGLAHLLLLLTFGGSAFGHLTTSSRYSTRLPKSSTLL